MGKFIEKMIKGFLVIDLLIMSVLIVFMVLFYISFNIHYIKGIDVDFGYFLILFVIPFRLIVFSIIEIIFALIFLLFTLKKNSIFQIDKKSYIFLLPLCSLIIYSIYFIGSGFRDDNVILLYLIINCIVILLWQLCLYNNENFNKYLFKIFSIIAPFHQLILYYLVFEQGI